MLTELIRKMEEPAAEVDPESEPIRRFQSLLKFLSKPQFFPNEQINELARTSRKILLTGMVFMDIVDQETISFGISSEEVEELPGDPARMDLGVIILPSSFTEHTQTHLGYALIQVASAASLIKDYFYNRFDEPDVSMRFMAYEAESLLTLKTMIEQEGLSYNVDRFKDIEAMQKFPNGLEDLPKGVNYQSPRIFAPFAVRHRINDSPSYLFYPN